MRLSTLQQHFAAHLRDPEHVAPPEGIEPRRMAIYRELFFNNLASLLAGSFPVCRAILGDEAWRRLVRRFYAGHRAHTPYFLEIPREFLEWLTGRPAAPADEPAFLGELAHYEWVELALSVSEAEADLAGVDPEGDLMRGHPVASPLAWPLAYRWPVHRLAPGYQPTEPPAVPTVLVVYRDDGDAVRFLEADAPTARLLELADSDEAATGRQLIERVAAELGVSEAREVMERGQALLAGLRARGILLGARAIASDLA